MINFTKKEVSILKELACSVAELANDPVENEKMKLWYTHNALGETRPLVFCDPEHGWTEIIPQASLKCENEKARFWEYLLRKEVFWGKEMRDDRMIEPNFNVAHCYVESDWGMHETKKGGESGGSFCWDSPLKSYDDLNKLHHPIITIDNETTSRMLELAHEIFDGVLNVKLKTGWWWSLGMTMILVYIRGMEQIMFDMADSPDKLHKLMSILRDGTLAKLNFLEENNLLSLNNDFTYVGSGGFGWTRELPQKDFNGKVRTIDMWGFCESQETVGVGPEMFEEFIFSYQKPILERFGLACYGCCEPINDRWEIINKLPNLRRVSVSPFSNVEDMSDKLGNGYILSLKPTPNDLATDIFNEKEVRSRLRNLMKVTWKNRVELILKDTHTIRNEPDRVIKWVKIAKEEAMSI